MPASHPPKNRLRLSAKPSPQHLRLAALGSLVLLPSCMSFYSHQISYTEPVPRTQNGALINAQVKPNGGKAHFAASLMIVGAASATEEGPYLFRIVALGNSPLQHMSIHAITLHFPETGATTQHSPRGLNQPIPFQALKDDDGEDGTPYTHAAVFQSPHEIAAEPQTHGALHLSVDLTIQSETTDVRETQYFILQPSDQHESQHIFIPVEIFNDEEEDPLTWKPHITDAASTSNPDDAQLPLTAAE